MRPGRLEKRWITRDVFLGAVYYSGLGWLYDALLGRRRGIIVYHNVLPEVLVAKRTCTWGFCAASFNLRCWPVTALREAQPNIDPTDCHIPAV